MTDKQQTGGTPMNRPDSIPEDIWVTANQLAAARAEGKRWAEMVEPIARLVAEERERSVALALEFAKAVEEEGGPVMKPYQSACAAFTRSLAVSIATGTPANLGYWQEVSKQELLASIEALGTVKH